VKEQNGCDMFKRGSLIAYMYVCIIQYQV